MQIKLTQSLSDEIKKIAQEKNKTIEEVLTSSLINGLRCLKVSSSDSHCMILNPKNIAKGNHLIFKINK